MLAMHQHPGGPRPHALPPAELAELLMDLAHDLGKYLKMPLAFLPATASAQEVQLALHKALWRTRETPQGVRTARHLWEAFCAQAQASLATHPRFPPLQAAVEHALAWETAAASTGVALDRAAAERDLGAVLPAVKALLHALTP